MAIIQTKYQHGRVSNVSYLLAATLPNLVANLKVPGVVPDGGEHFLRRLLAIGEEFDAAVNRTWNDRDLSAVGQKKRLVIIAREALAKLSEFESDVIHKLTDRINITTRGLLDAVKPTPETDIANAIIGELRRREIRDAVRQFDRETRVALYNNALHQGLAEIVRALDEAPHEPFAPEGGLTAGQLPKWRPFMNVQSAEQQLIERAKAANPDRARELDAITNLRDTLAAQVQALRRLIGEEVNLQQLETQFAKA